MGAISWIILGALSGWIASIIKGKNQSMGAIANIVVGIVGAMIGGFIANSFGGAGVTGFNLYSIFISVVGAVILLTVLNMLGSKR